MSDADRFREGFVPAYVNNSLKALVHRFYAAWEDLRGGADRVLEELDPAGFQLDLSLLGKLETEEQVREAWKSVSGSLSHAAHHVLGVTVEAGEGGAQVAKVKLVGQLVDHGGHMKVLELESELRCVLDRGGRWRIRHYCVHEVGAGEA